ncbi:SprT-like domain-containing protein [Xenococcus sp. PCC 7305]|uniref:SprT-like domain-containing protein n=1 Tax=Xenococcus sp. PCC 7305 TaxID=102125 RepID=UPI001181C35E|nr:SprT-like domain-containing protein [Xenococcus sp. PCC 7305]
MAKPAIKPTAEQLECFYLLFDHFNQHLFENRLPYPYFQFQNLSRCDGAFKPKVWIRHQEEEAHLILLSPKLIQSSDELCETLTRMMVHLEYYLESGESNQSSRRSGYYSQGWAERMKRVGLMPSSTGQPGGLEHGYGIKHYVEEGGRFEQAYQELPSDIFVWQMKYPYAPTKKPPEKVTYQCPQCELELKLVKLPPAITPLCNGECGYNKIEVPEGESGIVFIEKPQQLIFK